MTTLLMPSEAQEAIDALRANIDAMAAENAQLRERATEAEARAAYFCTVLASIRAEARRSAINKAADYAQSVGVFPGVVSAIRALASGGERGATVTTANGRVGRFVPCDGACDQQAAPCGGRHFVDVPVAGGERWPADGATRSDWFGPRQMVTCEADPKPHPVGLHPIRWISALDGHASQPTPETHRAGCRRTDATWDVDCARCCSMFASQPTHRDANGSEVEADHGR